MSSGPSEPEKYSIDEMMDRLKNVPSENPEDGELVTRADGTQAIRVRKRKRRSTQPHKEARHRTRRSRILQVSSALVLLLGAALVAGVAIIYANSSPFRKGLVSKIEQASGAKTELQQFRVNPKTANAGSLSLEWPEGNVLKNLQLRGLSAEIFPASFLGKNLTGEEISITHGVLNLQTPTPGQPRTHIVPGASAIHFNRYRSPMLDLNLGNPESPYLKLTKTEGSLSPTNVNGRPQLSLYRGDLSIAGWPKMKLDRALVVFRGEDADVVGLRLLNDGDDRGSLEFSGTVSPFKPDHASTLAVTLDSFQLAGLTGPGLGRLFSGKVDSLPVADSNYLSFRPGENPAPKLEIAFRASPTSRVEVTGFPFLIGLAECMDEWFEKPVFEGDASGVFHREGDVTTIRKIHFESKDRMAIRGEIAIARDQTLSGRLEVGVAGNMIASANTPRLKTMFGPSKEGFQWITLKISGSASAPMDNFKEIFLSARTAVVPAAEPEHEESTFEELTKPR